MIIIGDNMNDREPKITEVFTKTVNDHHDKIKNAKRDKILETAKKLSVEERSNLVKELINNSVRPNDTKVYPTSRHTESKTEKMFQKAAVAVALLAGLVSVKQSVDIVQQELERRAIYEQQMDELGQLIPIKLSAVESKDARFILYQQVADTYHLNLEDQKATDAMFYLVYSGSSKQTQKANLTQVLNDYGFGLRESYSSDEERFQSAIQDLCVNRGYYATYSDGSKAPDGAVWERYATAYLNQLSENNQMTGGNSHARI